MLKLKIAMAALAVIATASLVNCSEYQGNHSTPAAGPKLNSETPSADDGTEQANQEYLQKVEYRAGITADLNQIAGRRVGESLCSASDQEALATQQEVVNTGSRVHTFEAPLSRIMDQNQSVEQVQYAVDALVRILRSAENHHCAMNVAAQAASFGVSDLMNNQEIAHSMDTSEATSERYEAMVQKADHIRDGLLPLVNELQREINADSRDAWIQMASNYEQMAAQVNEKITLLGQLIELVRASYQCEEGGSCSEVELARGAIVVNSDNAIAAAQQTLSSFSIQEPGDVRLNQDRIDALSAHDSELGRYQISLTNIVRRIEQEQGATQTPAE